MRDYLNIGSTPTEEECFPCGHPLAHRECRIYCEQLKREFPRGVFTVKSFPHDFGSYYEVVAWYNAEEESEAMTAAFDAESSAHPYWDAYAAPEILELRNRA